MYLGPGYCDFFLATCVEEVIKGGGTNIRCHECLAAFQKSTDFQLMNISFPSLRKKVMATVGAVFDEFTAKIKKVQNRPPSVCAEQVSYKSLKKYIYLKRVDFEGLLN